MTDGLQREISLHIDRIVLKGIDLPVEQRAVFEAALIAELTGLLSEGSLASSLVLGGAYAEATPGHIVLTNQLEPGRLGNQIAAAVFSGLGGAEAGGQTNE